MLHKDSPVLGQQTNRIGAEIVLARHQHRKGGAKALWTGARRRGGGGAKVATTQRWEKREILANQVKDPNEQISIALDEAPVFRRDNEALLLS